MINTNIAFAKGKSSKIVSTTILPKSNTFITLTKRNLHIEEKLLCLIQVYNQHRHLYTSSLTMIPKFSSFVINQISP